MKPYKKNNGKLKNTGYLDSIDLINDLNTIQRLAGIKNKPEESIEPTINDGSNISVTADETVRIMYDNNIKPGTPEWFRLWFSRPYLTGETKI